MEPNNNLQKMIAKKLWHMLRVAIFMLKKGISKTKLFSDLNLLLKRGKIAGKVIHKLLFHQNHNHIPTTSDLLTTTTQHHLHDEYEFSCSNTPSHPFTNLFKRKNHHHQMLALEEDDEVMNANVVMKALERLQSDMASPALPRFGKTPVMRKMKMKDSPFHQVNNGDEDSHVDEAADEFIKRFYKNLRKQNSFAAA